jgi:uncharacterized membrane protein
VLVPQEFIPEIGQWVAWLVWLAAVGLAFGQAPWNAMRAAHRQHLFLGSLVALAFLWRLEAGIAPGLGFHFLAVTTLVLMFGWSLAVIGAGAVQAVLLVVADGGTAALGLNALLSGVLPASITLLVYRLVMRYLPLNPFIYIFVCAFFTGMLVAVCTVLARMAVMAAGDAYSYARMTGEYLLFLPLYAFPEGFINGMIVTVLVVFRPAWVRTFFEPGPSTRA